MRISIVNTYFFCFLYLVLSLTTKVQAQTVDPQVLPFDKICAGSKFNEFNATFIHSGFPAGTTFDVLLSDNTGSFTNPVSTITLAVTDITASQKTIKFAVPTTIVGSDIYKLRVKSSTGYTSSNFFVKNPNGGTLTSFPAYYKPFEEAFFINSKQSAATICTGGNVVLSIDNPTPSIPNSSPVNYPSIKYKWYKNTIVIAGETSSSLVANSAGTYYVALDYGSCFDSNFISNTVTVTQSAGGASGSVSSSLGNTICSGGAFTTLSSSIKGNTYQWYKNNVKINGATNATYSTNQGGLYAVKIDFGGCASTYSIDLKEIKTISSTINISNPTTIKEGDTVTVVVKTEDVNATFEWYAENSLIPGNNTNTYDVTSVGSYSVKVFSNSGCGAIVEEFPFVVEPYVPSSTVEIPNLITPNGDGKNEFWNIPEKYVDNNTQVVIMNSNGEVVFTTDNYENNDSSLSNPNNNWPNSNNPINFKSVNPVYYYIMTAQNGEVKKGSITIVK
ncbi:MAG TPA: gliding motility-associated C-terminal domain-containing protein [Flavobacterium sp.]